MFSACINLVLLSFYDFPSIACVVTSYGSRMFSANLRRHFVPLYKNCSQCLCGLLNSSVMKNNVFICVFFVVTMFENLCLANKTLLALHIYDQEDLPVAINLLTKQIIASFCHKFKYLNNFIKFIIATINVRIVGLTPE